MYGSARLSVLRSLWIDDDRVIDAPPYISVSVSRISYTGPGAN